MASPDESQRRVGPERLAHLSQFTDEHLAYHEAGHAIVHHLRGGSVTRTARFMSSRVLALVEHPAPRPAQPDDLPSGDGRRRPPESDPAAAKTESRGRPS